MEVVGIALVSVGALVSFLAAVGVLDFPSPLTRMHAATKSASLGLSLITVGTGVAGGSAGTVIIGILVSVFLFLTAPISGHMIGRAAYYAGHVDSLVHDDLAGVDPRPPDSTGDGIRRFSWGRWVASIAVWAALWRDARPGTLVGGAIVASILEGIRNSSDRPVRIEWRSAVRLLAFYLGQVIVSNARVAWEVITPRNEAIREAIVACPLQTTSTRVAFLVANAVTFAPGTLTVEMGGDPLTLYVHVLHHSTPEDVRQEVGRLEQRVMRALPAEDPASAADRH